MNLAPVSCGKGKAGDRHVPLSGAGGIGLPVTSFYHEPRCWLAVRLAGGGLGGHVTSGLGPDIVRKAAEWKDGVTKAKHTT